LPKGRSYDYVVWRACERFGIKPPLVKENWDDMDWWTQQSLLQYDAGRTIEDKDEQFEFLSVMFGAKQC